MKKIVLLAISILMVSAVFARTRTENPIPSFNVLLKSATYFQESLRPSINYTSDEKRDMNVSNDGSGANGSGLESAAILVYVYRLDGSKTLGPFIVNPGQTKTVQIDGNQWGVYASSNRPTYMSVWTNDGL
jgi:hypothetical protein